MFFIKQLSHPIQLHPSYFSPAIKEFLAEKLRTDVEGTCDPRHGYIIAVLRIESTGDGVVMPGTGLAEFNIRFIAVVLKPFKGEVVDALVTNVTKQGFFSEVGPLSIFTSQHLIPPQFKFEPDSNPPEWTSNEGMNIVNGKKVRIRLVGARQDLNDIFAIGTMKEDFLGPFD